MTEHEKRIREALEAGPKLTQSSVMYFAESLHGKAGELDAWLECNDEKEVKAHVIAYAGALLADLDNERRENDLRKDLVASGNDLVNKLNADLDAMREALERIAADGWKKGYTFCHPEGCESPGIAIAALKGASA